MTEVRSGLEGVVAFASTIAEPDRDGGALRYRGVDIEELAGRVPYEQVWGLLVDDALTPGLEPVVPRDLPVRSGNTRADVQAAGRDARDAAADRHRRRAGARRSGEHLRAHARLRRAIRPRRRPRTGSGDRTAPPPSAS